MAVTHQPSSLRLKYPAGLYLTATRKTQTLYQHMKKFRMEDDGHSPRWITQ